MAEEKRYLGPLEDKFTIEDVGSTLLEHLAKGLYQPNEVIREYVQNAVDAHREYKDATGALPADPIHIEIRGDCVSFYDSGIGMDESDIKKVKSVAVSNKTAADVQLTGHKGVGIWAGLSYFKQLTMFTTKRGSDTEFKLTIRFKNVVDAISPEVHIGDALNPNYSIEKFAVDIDEHYTIVLLEHPTRSEDQFLEAGQVKDAVRRICPCEVDPNFVFGLKLLDWYADHKIEIYPMEVNGERVYKSYPSAVENWETNKITVNDVTVAEYWSAVHQKSGRLYPAEGQLAGFRLVQSGFVIGDANPYSKEELLPYSAIPKNNYINWHIGEFHITSSNLRPNLQRNQLEEVQDTRHFVEKLREFYRTTDTHDRVLGTKRRTLNLYRKYKIFVAQLLVRDTMNLTSEENKHVADIKQELKKQDDIARSHKKDTDADAFRDAEVKNLRRELLDTLKIIYDRHDKETEHTSRGAQERGGSSSASSSLWADLAEASNESIEIGPVNFSTTTSLSEDDDRPSNQDEGLFNEAIDIAISSFETGLSAENGDPLTLASESLEEINNEELAETEEFIPLALVFTLVEQILDEELTNQEDVRGVILSKLRARVNWMVNHG